ncbi:MAG: RnfABCDGE type electron transport complex subunit D, partial [bacterium]|nr:RnfABCDGE type electron transport complex subunit D [bacterium]
MSVENRFILSPGPHLSQGLTTKEIMWWVSASLFPIFAWGVALFGGRVLLLLASGILGGMGGEFFVNFLRRQKQTLTDGSAVLTGILLVGTLSPGLPLWMPAAGSFVAIVFGKMLFGGLGYNIFNPALIGRAFLMATFPLAMTATWLKPFDAVTMATPLNLLKLEGVQNAVYRDLFFGVRSGSIGELSVFLVL